MPHRQEHDMSDLGVEARGSEVGSDDEALPTDAAQATLDGVNSQTPPEPAIEGQWSGVRSDNENPTPNPQPPTPDLAAEYLEALQRERANFINYRRRSEQERAETVQYATSNFLKRFLPVVDDFDRALAAIPAEERQNNRWVEGVELIARKLHNILEQEGVEPIEALGQPFDPNLHEAVAFEDNTGEGEDHTDTVAEVYSKGYKMKDRVLRPAMVKVSRG
ncbi:MAG: nucleotide exchange factor GrpE [Chloroflexia bacterium]